jgi:hypothetical protein
MYSQTNPYRNSFKQKQRNGIKGFDLLTAISSRKRKKEKVKRGRN